MELGEKSKTLKRRLRRERIAMEKAGDFLPFTPTIPLVAEVSEEVPKRTNSAKRAARKRRKLALWQQEVNDICSDSSNRPTVVLKGKKGHDNLTSKNGSGAKHIKFSGDEDPSPSNDKNVKPTLTSMSQEDNEADNSNVDGSNYNNDQSSKDKAEHSESTKALTSMSQEDNEADNSNVDGSDYNNDQSSKDKAEPSESTKDAKKDMPPKKRRYVLFVGNLSYETKEADVVEHFKKIGVIISVRIAKHKDKDTCRGFCHLEVGDEETYLKALSLHHTFMAKRRINVEYSSGQSEEKGEIKRKNFKLQTLNKIGRLVGSKLHQNKSVNKVKAKPEEKLRGAFFV